MKVRGHYDIFGAVPASHQRSWSPLQMMHCSSLGKLQKTFLGESVAIMTPSELCKSVTREAGHLCKGALAKSLKAAYLKHCQRHNGPRVLSL